MNTGNEVETVNGKGRKYNKISFEDRKKLIDLVQNQNETCSRAAKILNISLSTAKMIVKKYQTKGEIFEKKEDRTKREIIESMKDEEESQKK